MDSMGTVYGWKSMMFSRNISHWLEHRISPIGFESDLTPAIIYSSALHSHERESVCWSQMLLSAFESAFTLFQSFSLPSFALCLSSPLCSIILTVCLSVCGFPDGFFKEDSLQLCTVADQFKCLSQCVFWIWLRAAVLKVTQNELQVFSDRVSDRKEKNITKSK